MVFSCSPFSHDIRSDLLQLYNSQNRNISVHIHIVLFTKLCSDGVIFLNEFISLYTNYINRNREEIDMGRVMYTGVDQLLNIMAAVVCKILLELRVERFSPKLYLA